MNLKNKLLFLFLLLFPVMANAQPRPATCRISEPDWKNGKIGSSPSGKFVGTFQLDGSEDYTIRSFNYQKSVVTVGIQFDTYRSKTYEVHLAIIVSDKEEERIFESVNSSEASTMYKKNWNLSVTKTVNEDDVNTDASSTKGFYMFTLYCYDGLKLPQR
jgi:hypothetical protein